MVFSSREITRTAQIDGEIIGSQFGEVKNTGLLGMGRDLGSFLGAPVAPGF